LVEILGNLELHDLARVALTCTHWARWCREIIHRRVRHGDVLRAVTAQDTAFLRAWLWHAESRAWGSQHVAVRCLLNFLVPDAVDGTSREVHASRRHAVLEAQLLCFIHHRDTGAAQVLLSHPSAVRLCHNPGRTWMEWHVSTVVWHMPRLPECVLAWARSLACLRPQDLTLTDNLFFHWSGTAQPMLDLMSTMTAAHMPMHDLLVLHVDTNSFAGHFLFSDSFVHSIGYVATSTKQDNNAID